MSPKTALATLVAVIAIGVIYTLVGYQAGHRAASPTCTAKQIVRWDGAEHTICQGTDAFIRYYLSTTNGQRDALRSVCNVREFRVKSKECDDL